MKRRILLVEDESSLARPLAFLLEEQGFKVQIAADGIEAVQEFDRFAPDLVLLDLMLPELSGMEVFRRIRGTSDVPVIMLTAKSGEIDKVLGLEMGADDYVTKPYSSRELLARINTVLRRATRIPEALLDDQEDDDVLTAGPVTVDAGRHSVEINGEQVEMPLKEFQLLQMLIANAGRVVTRGQLLDRVWGSDFFGDERTLDVHVKRLRSRFAAHLPPKKLIKTVRGVGYRLDPELDVP